MSVKPCILLTNDDGYDADGLRTLRTVVADYGPSCTVAPAQQQSMKSHAITTGPIRVDKDTSVDFGYRCDSVPADCVRLGLRHLPIGPIDVVFSGINHGANLGVDFFYSGTIGAAREAALLGTPAIAVSQLTRRDHAHDWSHSARMLRLALEALWQHLGSGTMALDRLPPLTNINLPFTDTGGHAGIQFCDLTWAPMPVDFAPEITLDQASAAVHYTVSYFDRPAPEGSDVYWLFNNWITISLMNVDGTPVQR